MSASSFAATAAARSIERSSRRKCSPTGLRGRPTATRRARGKAIAKGFDADPFFRQQTVQGLFGRSLSASTIFDQIEHVANAFNPVYRALMRAVAASSLFHIDDTTHRILDAAPVQKRRGKRTRWRTGVYSSVLSGTVAAEPLAEVDAETAAAVAAEAAYRVVLYQTNIGNAGEWLEEVLGHRPAGLAAPIVISDALASNRVHDVEVKVGGCNAHARRGFVELIGHYPREARFALKAFSTIWRNEGDAFERGLDPGERLAYHREHSGPAMEALHAWCERELASGAVEENGTLGQAMGYVLRHYEALTLFLCEPGVPLDNNLAERLLKLVVRGRRNSGFFKTSVGAEVGDVLASVLATCHENGVNAFDYLCAVQRHAATVRREPERWLPWNYAAAAVEASTVTTAAKTADA